ncbi:MAG: alpha/beta hydrolase [Cyanobacteriota bacterium]
MTEKETYLPAPPIGSTQRYRVGEQNLNVWMAGNDGPMLLLMHGIPTNHMLWRDVVPQLASRARVIAVDLFGYGNSSRPNGQPVDIAAQASYINELMNELGVERATVVGHDIGGGVAQILATRYSERVERLGLIDAVCYDGWPVPAMKALKIASPIVEHLPDQPTIAALKQALRVGFVHQDRAKEFVDYFMQPFSTDDGLEVFMQHVRSLNPKYTEEIAPLLPQLRVPTAILWGWHDDQMKKQYGEQLAADIPTSELTWIKNSHHFAPADAPDAVADALHHLLDRPVETPVAI